VNRPRDILIPIPLCRAPTSPAGLAREPLVQIAAIPFDASSTRTSVTNGIRESQRRNFPPLNADCLSPPLSSFHRWNDSSWRLGRGERERKFLPRAERLFANKRTCCGVLLDDLGLRQTIVHSASGNTEPTCPRFPPRGFSDARRPSVWRRPSRGKRPRTLNRSGHQQAFTFCLWSPLGGLWLQANLTMSVACCRARIVIA
jgi:hypothetical protein